MVLAAGALRAQAPVLVKDICQGTTAGSDPYAFTTVGDSVLFVANDHLGPHLYRTDGTEAGTVVVRDLSCPFFRVLGVEGDRMLYLCSYTGSSSELWESDGTSVGTRLVKQTLMTPLHIAASAEMAGTRYFVMDAAGGGFELWRMDGVDITKVRTIAPKGVIWGGYFITVAGGRLYFPGNDGIHGLELWTSDGTAAGTTMVRDIEPGSAGSHPQSPSFGEGGGRLAFVACPAATGCQVWLTDGTTSGTSMLRQIGGQPDIYRAPSGLSFVNGVLVFSAADDIWCSDLTSAGTTVLMARTTSFSPLGQVGRTLVGQCGSGLCRTDGTAQGSGQLVSPGYPAPTFPEKPVLRVGGRLFMSAMSGPNGYELWVTDGTGPGTYPVGAAHGLRVVEPRLGAQLGDTVIYSAFTTEAGRELWRSEGTASSTLLVLDIDLANPTSLPVGLTASGDLLYFVTKQCPQGDALWCTDGSETGTRLLKSFSSTQTTTGAAQILAPTARGVLLIGNDGVKGWKLWISDGTAAGTLPFLASDAPDLTPLPAGVLYRSGIVYFAATDPEGVRGLWRSDGTLAGTSLVWRGSERIAEGSINWLAPTKDGVVFLSYDSGGATLWAADGSPVSPRRLIGAESGVSFLANNPQLTTLGDLVFFVATDEAHGEELWRTDGTPEGTMMVADIATDTIVGSSFPYDLAVRYGRLVFVALDQEHGGELWTSDGTAAGTRRVADIWPGRGGSWPRALREGPGGFLYFSAFEPLHGRQLWRSDLTAEGTQLVSEVAPYPDSIEMLDGATAGDSFFFSFRCTPGYRLTCPREPTLALTRASTLATRILPGARPGHPALIGSYFASLGTCVFFTGSDPLHNFELRKICESTPRVPRGRVGAAH